MTKQHKLATIPELCQTENHENEYESRNEKNNVNKKVTRDQMKRMKKRTKSMKSPTIALNFTHLKKNEELPAKKCVWRKCSECGVEK